MTPSPRRRMLLVFAAFLVCAVIVGALAYRKYRLGHDLPAVPPPVQQSGTRVVTLFFADPEGRGLARELREIDDCSGTSSCVESILEELTNGPIGDLDPTLPAAFSVRNVAVVNGVAVVDLEKGGEEGLPEGSSAEMTAVYSIIDTVALNLPEVKKVKFLVDGEPVPTWKGHLDLREPLPPDFSMEVK